MLEVGKKVYFEKRMFLELLTNTATRLVLHAYLGRQDCAKPAPGCGGDPGVQHRGKDPQGRLLPEAHQQEEVCGCRQRGALELHFQEAGQDLHPVRYRW